MIESMPVKDWPSLLRQEAERVARDEDDDLADPFALRGAADEIERLRAENHVLREMNRQREEFGAKAVRLAFPHLNTEQ